MHNSGKMRINLRVKKKINKDWPWLHVHYLQLRYAARHILVVPNIFKKILFYGLSRLFHSFLVKSVGRTGPKMGDIYENKHLTSRKQNLACLSNQLQWNDEQYSVLNTWPQGEHPAVSWKMRLMLWLDARLYVEWRPLLCGVTPVILLSDARHFVDWRQSFMIWRVAI